MQLRTQHDTERPWSALCRLCVRFPSGAEIPASGWVAGHRIIVTAAHSLYRKRANQRPERAKEVEVWISRFERDHIDHFITRDLREPEAWLESRAEAWDLAVVVAARAPLLRGHDGAPAWLSSGSISKADVRDGTAMTVAGYRESQPRRMSYRDDLTLRHAGPGRLTYARSSTSPDTRTGRGMSGGPVWITHAYEGQLHAWAIGVHTHGSKHADRAVFLDPERIEWIDRQDRP